MPNWKIVCLAALAMMGFAGNSLLARLAFRTTGIDAIGFTTIRMVSGALTLCLLLAARGKGRWPTGDWTSALILICSTAGLAFAYVRLPAASGALILFGAVQATMIGYGIFRGERLRRWQVLGLCVASGGLVCLMLPGLAAPPPGGAAVMVFTGVAWGSYSLRGQSGGDPVAVTAGNFLRTVPLALILAMAARKGLPLPPGAGVAYAVVVGVVTSALAFVVWYTVLPHLTATVAATIQLSVPVLAAVGGVLWLGESVTWRLAGCSLAILGGIGLVIMTRNAPPAVDANRPTSTPSSRQPESAPLAP